ncbi:MAG: lysoplasmalogenase [Ginsengibacter sp.]
MKKQSWIIFFIIILTVHLAGIGLKMKLAEHFSKPMIVVLLILYFLSQTNNIKSGLKKWILAALFFSWAGDILLMFQQNNSLFFLTGLSAFLIAHIFYIIFFHLVRVKEKVHLNVWLLLIVLIYYISLITFLSSHLGNMKLPVIIYGIVISCMFMLAMHMLFTKNKRAGNWMMSGALLFVISDSVLAVNKFYQSFEMAGVIIMLTYGLAQLFIVEGAIKYIVSIDEE